MSDSEVNPYITEIKNKLEGEDNCYSVGAISAEERKKKIKIRTENKQNYCRIKVDKCVIRDNNTKKCDYVFVKIDTKQFLFVELKGKLNEEKFNEAYDQLCRTITYFKDKLSIDKDKIYAYIVAKGISIKIPRSIRNFKKKGFENKKKEFEKKIGKRLERESVEAHIDEKTFFQ